jgi:hypothetical protein
MTMLFDNTPDEIIARRKGECVPLLAAYGAGLNSTAGLILLAKQGDIPDAILFADTGSEKDATYAYLELFDGWCKANGLPGIKTVVYDVDHNRQKNEQKYSTLEEACLVHKCLPSIAYYGRSCSIKWKHTPQEKWANSWPTAKARWEGNGHVVKAIFYDADEPFRVKHHRDSKYAYWHPLVDQDIGRDECEQIVKRAGLPIPPKSSCYFCPEMTPEEIAELERTEPHNLAKALAMEANADLTSIKGLGKHEYSWREMVASRYTLEVVQEKKMPCMCYDGGGLY